MSFKSIIQIIIILIIIFILGGVYFKYFSPEKANIEEETTKFENEEFNQELENRITELERKNEELEEEIENKIKNLEKEKLEIEKKEAEKKLIEAEKKLEEQKKLIEKEKNLKKEKSVTKKKVEKKKKIKNIVKNVEYTSTDKRGNKFKLLASSGKSNINNNDLLDLENVKGVISSDKRDTIYIASDFAQYNASNLNSKFYQNVIINYQDKEIICENFDIEMESNMAIAYNNVIITDPKSVMKAGEVTFDLKTKNISINPENKKTKVEVVTN